MGGDFTTFVVLMVATNNLAVQILICLVGLMSTFLNFMDPANAKSVITDVQVPETSQIVTILDESSVVSDGGVDHGRMPIVPSMNTLATFLQRPVFIQSYNWPINGLPYLALDPWTLFLTNTSIREKTRYFARLRGTLVLRVNISATPFHYGLAKLCYRPHPGAIYASDPVFNHAIATEAAGAATNLRLVGSQLPGIYINPCRNAGVELRIPYQHFRPGIELTSGPYNDICTVYLLGIAPLLHANDGTGGISLQIYAHLEDATLDVPTAVAQGFGVDDVRAGARQFFKAATTATELAAEWVPRLASTAAMLGLSRPLLHETPQDVRNIPYNLSNYDRPDSSVPLSLSAGAEHSIDGLELGASGEDELMLSSIAARPAIVAAPRWTSTMTNGAFLYGALVTPCVSNVSAYTKAPVGAITYAAVSHACLTPCAFAASLARYWRGTMVYKFTVVASPYHKGRLRVYFDPMIVFVSGSSPAANLTNSVVIDLSESAEAIVEVPWQNVRDMAATNNMFTSNSFTIAAEFQVRCAAADTTHANGIIVCEVLGGLVGPTDGAQVYVVVEVAAKDLVLYSPTVPRATTGGGLISDMAAVPYTPLGFDITGGDAILSLRQLVKRYTVEYAIQPVCTTAAGTSRLLAIALPLVMPAPGYPQTQSALAALDLDTNGQYFNYTGMTFRQYVSQAFALARGGIRWKVVGGPKYNTTLAGANTWVYRSHGVPANFVSRRLEAAAGSISALNATASSWANNVPLDEGAQAAEVSANGLSSADVQFPFVSLYRAVNPRLSMSTTTDRRDKMYAVVATEVAPATSSFSNYKVMSSVGEDYNLFCFIHAPAFLNGVPANV